MFGVQIFKHCTAATTILYLKVNSIILTLISSEIPFKLFCHFQLLKFYMICNDKNSMKVLHNGKICHH